MGVKHRRREHAQYLADQAANLRPAESPRPPIAAADHCPARLGVPCDFGSVNRDDPRGSGVYTVRCWYCSRLSPASTNRVDEWRAAHEGATR